MKFINKIALILITMLVAHFWATASAQVQIQSHNDANQAHTAKNSTKTPFDVFGGMGQPNAESTGAPQTSDSDPDQWHFQFSPYLWIAGVSGRAGIGDLEVEVDSGLTDPNVKLNSGFMGVFEARKNKFVLLTDIQYSNLGTERPNPGILFSSASVDFKTFILDPEVGYRVAENAEKRRSLDVLGGIRYWHLETNLNFAAGILAARSATASRGWVDAVGGVRGKMYLSKSIFTMGKADLGGGGAKFTYQLLGGVGFHVHRKIALVAGYRAIHVNYDKDNFLFDTTLQGPIIGATFVIQ